MCIKFGVIGVGNIGSAHAKALYEGRIEGATLCAVCDVSEQKRNWARETFPNVAVYADHTSFFAESGADAVILSVPHYFHPPYAEEGFRAGMHVLTEKPAGVNASAVKQMNRAAKESGKVFGIMFNQRTDPLYAEVRRLVRAEEIGKPLRLLWEVTTWYRDQAYYDSGDWRATWSGEGGGVLMNQAPHQLDLMQWIFGLPDEVTARCHIGKYHNIEVEDEATLFCSYENGATAVFHTSTGEKHGVNRLEIVGTKGRIVAEKRSLRLCDGKELVWEKTFDDRGGQHVGILQNLTDAIRSGAPLLAPGEEGLRGVELCNAAYLSAWTGAPARIPTDTERFDLLLEERKTRCARKETEQSATDFDGTYKSRWSNT